MPQLNLLRATVVVAIAGAMAAGETDTGGCLSDPLLEVAVSVPPGDSIWVDTPGAVLQVMPAIEEMFV